MPTRIRYQRWARQPAAAVPLSTILRPQFLAAWDFRRNLAAGRDASTYTTSGIAETAGRFGRGLQFAAGSPGTGQVLHPFADAAQFSFVAAGEFGSTGGGNALGRVVSTFDGANGYDLYFDGSTFNYGCTFVGSGRASWTYALPSAERVSVIAISHDASSAANSPIIYVNGSRRTLTVNTAASGSRAAHGGTLGIGCRPDSTARQFEGSLYLVGAWRQALSESALADLTLNPWQLFAPRQIRVPVAAGGGVGGTAVQALSAATQSAAGSVSVAGTSVQGLRPATQAAAGAVALAGSGSQGLAAVTQSAAASVALSGSGTQTFGQVTQVASGVVGSAISGSASQTLNVYTQSAAGSVAVAGSATTALSEATQAAAGSVSVAGSSSSTLDVLTQAAAAGVLVAGTSQAPLSVVTQQAAAAVGSFVSGSASSVLDAVLQTAAGSVSGVAAVGGGGGIPKRRRWVLEHRGTLYEFATQDEMRAAGAQLIAQDIQAEAAAKAQTRKQRRSKPQRQVDTADVMAELGAIDAVAIDTAATMAALQGLIDAYNAAYNSQQWGDVMEVFRRAREQDDDEAIAALLMA